MYCKLPHVHIFGVVFSSRFYHDFWFEITFLCWLLDFTEILHLYELRTKLLLSCFFAEYLLNLLLFVQSISKKA